MAKLSRFNDLTKKNGKLLRKAKTVFANGKPIALHPSDISSHPKKDTNSKTTKGVKTVFAENCPVLKVGSPTSCGHKVATGSKDVNVP